MLSPALTGAYRTAPRNQLFFLCLNPRSVALRIGDMSNARAVRYRRLALAEDDKTKVDLLLKLADECDLGLLCTAEWRSGGQSFKNVQPSKPEEFKMWRAE